MLSFLFKKKEVEKKTNPVIDRFIEEHKNLVNLYIEIYTLATEKQFSQIKDKLKIFETTLLNHINDERELIYDHLNEVLNNTTKENILLLKEINKIKAEIVPIKKKINIINLKYRELNEENINNFIEHLEYLKEPILNRIELEEKKLFMYFEKKQKR